jgi:hypothetical protein
MFDRPLANRIFTANRVLAGLSLLAGTCLAQEASVPGMFYAGGKSTATHRAVPAQEVPGIESGLDRAPEFALPALETGPVAGDTGNARYGRLQVGRVREVPQSIERTGEWASIRDGRSIWRVTLRSAGARMVRVHFEEFQVGEGQVFLYSDAAGVQRFSGGGLYGDGEFWTATVRGDRVTIEYVPAEGLQAEELPFRIAGVTHIWEDLEAAEGAATAALALAPRDAPGHPVSALAVNGAGSGNNVAACHLDVSCYPEWRREASGVARILFVTGQFVSACSGALINSRSNSGKPLFLTADHCISNEAEARSVQANFFYETASCGAGDANFGGVKNILGASYLDSDDIPNGDYSLIQLAGVPDNVYFFGWTTAEPAMGAKLTGIHHPDASFKRISFGERVEDEGIIVGGTTREYAPEDKFYSVHLIQGKAQGGSSGSPLINANRQIVGLLSAGPSYSIDPDEDERLLCEDPRLVVYYGRLKAGIDALRPWLEDLRPAYIAFPRPGEALPGTSVDFRWSSGVGAKEYRLLVGREVGSGEIFNQSTGLTPHAMVNGLPRDGRPVHVRLMTLLESGWEAVDFTFLAQNGARVDAAAMTSPAPGSAISQATVEFRWSPGVKVDEYRLEVGTSLGGGDVFGRSTGKETRALVSNIPLTGAPLHVRLWSYVGGEWLKRDYIYSTADTRRQTVSLRIVNRLAFPVSILVNERSVAGIAPGEGRTVEVPRREGTAVSWSLIRPSRPDTGGPLGEALSASIAVPEQNGEVEITNFVNGSYWFAPTVTNTTATPKLLEVNGVRLFYTLRRSEALSLGYHLLTSQSAVRGYSDVQGYSGSPMILREFHESTEAGSGAVALEFR